MIRPDFEEEKENLICFREGEASTHERTSTMLGATTLHSSRGIASAKTQRRNARRETSQFQLQCHCSRRPSNNNNNNNNRQDVEMLKKKKKKKKKKGERSASCEETPQVQRRALGVSDFCLNFCVSFRLQKKKTLEKLEVSSRRSTNMFFPLDVGCTIRLCSVA